MIDTKELRRLAQEAMHPVTKGRWMRLFGERTVYDRMEDGCRGIPVVSTPISPPHPFEAACLDFIAAANPAAITELLDRLEAAESDAAHQKALADSALRVAEGWEEKCNALRAKVAEMEKQEPVAYLPLSSARILESGVIANAVVWNCRDKAASDMPLYALPGAQPAPFDDNATIAGLESAVTHLSVLLDSFRALLVEVNDVCGRDGHGGQLEEGESEIIDKVRAAISMTEAPPCAKGEEK